MYRGITYKSPNEVIYNLRYLPLRVINDTTVSLELEIGFEKDYIYPNSCNSTFKIIPLPREWALDGKGVTDSMFNELPKYLINPHFNITLKPEEEVLFALGAFYVSGETPGLLPKELYIMENSEINSECKWYLNEPSETNVVNKLGLRFSISVNCFKMTCGRFYYSKN